MFAVKTDVDAESVTWHRHVEALIHGNTGVPVNTHEVGVPVGLVAWVPGFPETRCHE